MDKAVQTPELDLSTFDVDIEEVAMFIEQSDSTLLATAASRC